MTEGGLQTSVLIYFETRVLYSVEYMQQLSQPILSRSTFSSTKATHRMASPLSSCPEAHPNLRSHKAPRRPTASATSLLSSSQLSHINAVFTHAGPPPSEPPPKRRRLNVLPDDEEDDFDMIANVDTGASPSPVGRAAFGSCLTGRLACTSIWIILERWGRRGRGWAWEFGRSREVVAGRTELVGVGQLDCCCHSLALSLS